jgi:two-component system phosphate regulon response regulator PhoB
MARKILIVEDEKDISSLIARTLQKNGFDTVQAATGARAIELVDSERPDLALVDLMLPDVSGTDVCRHIRRSDELERMGVIVVSAKSEEIDRVVCFELGVDDYVTKPFSVRELVLRVQAVIRRVAGAGEGSQSSAPTISLGPITVDSVRHKVEVDNEPVELTYLEFELLRVMMERRGRVQSRERLINDVWGLDVEVTSRTVDTHVKRLRSKLGDARELIETVRGVGYRFREVVS